MSGFQWIDKESLEGRILETVSDRDYESFINGMERLVSLPYSYRVKDFIMEYCKSLMKQTTIADIPKPQYDKQGRAFITTYGNL